MVSVLSLKVMLVLVAVGSSLVLGQTQTTIGAARDNTLYESASGSLSNGAGDYFFVGRTNQAPGTSIRRGLLAFDVTGNVPPGATITNVVLTLTMSKTPAGATTLGLHRALVDWGEGTSHAFGEEGGGASPSAGDATWLHTFFDTTMWNNAGGDFSGTPSATQTVSGIGPYTWGSTAGMVADVQQWLDDPSSNFGWVLVGNEGVARTSKRFNTRENPNTNSRPSLMITYTMPPQPPLAPQLILPSDGAVIAADSVVFLWRSTQPAVEAYWFEHATDSLFGISTVDSTLVDTTTIVRLLADGQTYWWRVRARNTAGWGQFSVVRNFRIVLAGFGENEGTPSQFSLGQNFPNPFNPTTTITFEVPASAAVSLKVYTLMGQEVGTLVEGVKPAGRYKVVWHAVNVAGGVYFYRLVAGTFSETKKLMLLR